MKRLTLLLVMIASVAFGQSDTAQLNTLINANFPDNVSNFITPARLRTVSQELMRSGANLKEVNTFEKWAVFEDAVTGEDSIKSDVGFYVWDGAQYVEIGGGGSNWGRSGGFISPLTFSDKLNVDTARFSGNLYPDGSGVNIGRSDARFDTVFADVVEGIESSKWTLSNDSMYPSSEVETFLVSVTDVDTASSLFIGKIAGQIMSAMVHLSPLGVASISARAGRISATAPIINFNATEYARFSSDSIVVSGNFYAEDTLFSSVIDKSYGEMGFRDSAVTVVLDIDVPSWVTNSSNDLWQQSANTLKGVTYDGDSLVVNRAGVYYLSGHLSVAGNNNDVLRGYVYKNGTPLCLCSPVTSLVNNRIVNLQLNTDVAMLSVGDVLKVYVENIGTGNDVAAISGKLTLHRID
jgi:hypothetical protein